MKKRGGGQIINIGSLAGKNAFAGGAAYKARKFGLVCFSDAWMQEVRQGHIKVSCVMSGSVDKRFGAQAAQTQPSAWKLDPEDVASVVLSVLELDQRAIVSQLEIRPS